MRNLTITSNKCVFVAAVMIISILAGYLTVNDDMLAKPAIFFVSIAAFILLLVMVYSKSQPVDYFEPIWFLLFNGALALVVPVVMFFTGDYHFRFTHVSDAQAETLVIKGAVIIVVAYVCAVIGYYSSIGHRVADRMPRMPSYWNRRRAAFASMLIMMVSTLAFFWFLSQVGLSIIGMINDFAFGATRSLGQGYTRIVIQFSILAVCLLVVLFRKPERNILFWLGVVWATVMIVSFGSRTNVILWVWLPLLIVYHYYRRRLSVTPIVGVFIIILVFSAVMLDIRALSRQDASISFDQVTQDLDVGSVLDGAYREQSTFFDVLVWIIDNVPDRERPWLGRTYLNLLIAPIPRVLWPAKPMGFTEGNIITRMISGPELARVHGTPPDLPGLFYMHFLLPGVVAGMYLVGIVHRAIYEYFKLQKKNVAVIILYPVLWNSASLFFSVMGLAKVLPFLIGYLVVLRFITRGSSDK